MKNYLFVFTLLVANISMAGNKEFNSIREAVEECKKMGGTTVEQVNGADNPESPKVCFQAQCQLSTTADGGSKGAEYDGSYFICSSQEEYLKAQASFNNKYFRDQVAEAQNSRDSSQVPNPGGNGSSSANNGSVSKIEFRLPGGRIVSISNGMACWEQCKNDNYSNLCETCVRSSYPGYNWDYFFRPSGVADDGSSSSSSGRGDRGSRDDDDSRGGRRGGGRGSIRYFYADGTPCTKDSEIRYCLSEDEYDRLHSTSRRTSDCTGDCGVVNNGGVIVMGSKRTIGQDIAEVIGAIAPAASSIVGSVVWSNAYTAGQQAKWGAISNGFTQCANASNNYNSTQLSSYNASLDYNTAQQGTTIGAGQLANMQAIKQYDCSGMGLNQYAGYGGYTGDGFGGFGNTYGSAGYSNGFLGGMVGPYGAYGAGAYGGNGYGSGYFGNGYGNGGLGLNIGVGGNLGVGGNGYGYPGYGNGGIGLGIGVGVGGNGYGYPGYGYNGYAGVNANNPWGWGGNAGAGIANPFTGGSYYANGNANGQYCTMIYPSGCGGTGSGNGYYNQYQAQAQMNQFNSSGNSPYYNPYLYQNYTNAYQNMYGNGSGSGYGYSAFSPANVGFGASVGFGFGI